MRVAHRLLMAWMVFLLLIQGAMGMLLLLLGLSDQQRLRFGEWVMSCGSQLVFIGGLLIVLAILLIVVSVRLDRREYYQVKMGFLGLAAEIDLDVVRSLVGRYWQLNFPAVRSQVDALLRSDQTLELFVELPFSLAEERMRMMKKIETDLGRQFARHLGYRKPFFITVYTRSMNRPLA